MKSHPTPESFPYPVARPYVISHDAEEPLDRRARAIPFTVLQAIKLATLPVLTQYLSDPTETQDLTARDRRAVEAINEAIVGIRTPHYSNWITLLATLAGQLPRLDIRSCFPLAGLWQTVRQTRVPPLSRVYAPAGSSTDLNPLAAMQWLRNACFAHGADSLPTEAYRSVVDHYLPILDDVLENFEFLARSELLALAEDREALSPGLLCRVHRLMGPGEAEERRLELTEDWIAKFGDSSLVIVSPAGERLALYPLFYQNATEPCAQYDGHFAVSSDRHGGDERRAAEEHAVVYLGVTTGRFHDEMAFAPLQARLERRQIKWWTSKQECAPWTLYDSVRQSSWQTLAELDGQKYFPAIYLPREESLLHVRRFLSEDVVEQKPSSARRDTQTGFLLSGEAGSGKTAWCAHLVHELLHEGVSRDAADAEFTDAARSGRNLVFFSRGNAIRLSAGRSLFLHFAERVGLKVELLDQARVAASPRSRRDAGFTGFRELFQHLHVKWTHDQTRKDRRLVIVLDALNECEQAQQAVYEALQLVQEAALYPWCRVFISARSEFLNVLYAKKEGMTGPDPFDEPGRYFYDPENPPRAEIRPRFALRLPRFSEPEAREVYTRHQQVKPGRVQRGCTTPWNTLSIETQQTLTRPLLLHLFMEAYDGRPAESAGTDRQLYRAYLDHLRRRFPGVMESAFRTIEPMLKTGYAGLSDNDAHEIRRRWASGKSVDEIQSLLSPLELLEYAGLIKKRVSVDGGGYAFLFQRVLEQLIYETLRYQEGTERPSAAFWLPRAEETSCFHEYVAAFSFLFRELHEQDDDGLIVKLVMANLRAYDASLVPWRPGQPPPKNPRVPLTGPLEQFLTELMDENGRSLQISERVERLLKTIAESGSRMAWVLFMVAFRRWLEEGELHGPAVFMGAAVDARFGDEDDYCYMAVDEITILRKLGDTDRAAKLADWSYRQSWGQILRGGVRTQLHLSIGDFHWQVGNHTRASTAYENALIHADAEKRLKGPDRLRALIGSAVCALQLGDSTSMQTYLAAALALESSEVAGVDLGAATPIQTYIDRSDECFVKLGILGMAAGRPDVARSYFSRAIDVCERVLTRRPRAYDQLYQLGLAHLANGDFELATRIYERAIAACAEAGVRQEAIQGLHLLQCAAPENSSLQPVMALLSRERG